MADLRSAFLDAIRAEPDDDVPRLIFADWLDEQGEADRAEFVRLQIDLARAAPGPLDESMSRRAEELLSRHRADWLPGCEGVEWMVGFRRGFAEKVEISAGKEEAFAAKASRLFDLEPIQEITIDAAPGYLETFAVVPELSRIRCLRAPYLDAFHLSDLVGSPHLTGLRTLDLSKSAIWTDGVALLLQSSLLDTVTSLSLAGCRNIQGYDWDGVTWTDDTVYNVGDEGVIALTASRKLADVRRLDLSWNRLGDTAVEALVRSSHLRNLVELRIAERGRVEHDPIGVEREGVSSLTPAAVQQLRQRFGGVLRVWPEW